VRVGAAAPPAFDLRLDARRVARDRQHRRAEGEELLGDGQSYPERRARHERRPPGEAPAPAAGSRVCVRRQSEFLHVGKVRGKE